MNSVLPNLRKALFARCCWRNQQGRIRHNESAPPRPTMNGEEFDPLELVSIGSGITMTRLEQAKRLGGPDKWTFRVTFTYPANETITVEGEDATKLWKAWKAVVFGEKKD